MDPNDAIRGRGELRLREAGIEVARFDPDLMAQLEELKRDLIAIRREPSSGRCCCAGTTLGVLAEYNELWDKVWWNRHQVWRQKIESGETSS